MEDKKFGKKELFILGSAIFFIACFALVLGLPIFHINVAEGKYVYNKTIVDFLLSRESRFIISGSVVLAMAGFVLLMGIMFTFRSLLAYKKANDKEDKYFVFGSIMYMIANVALALYCLTNHFYIGMAIGLLGTVGGFGLIYLHYTRFTDY